MNLEKEVLINEIMRYRALLGWLCNERIRHNYTTLRMDQIRQYHKHWIWFAGERGVISESGEGSPDTGDAGPSG